MLYSLDELTLTGPAAPVVVGGVTVLLVRCPACDRPTTLHAPRPGVRCECGEVLVHARGRSRRAA